MNKDLINVLFQWRSIEITKAFYYWVFLQFLTKMTISASKLERQDHWHSREGNKHYVLCSLAIFFLFPFTITFSTERAL